MSITEPAGIEPVTAFIAGVDADGRAELAAQASRLGYEIATEASAILVDIGDAAPDSLDLIDRLKAERGDSAVPILVASSSQDPAVIREIIQRGAEDYLLKPVDATLLRVRLSAALERNRLRLQEQNRIAEIQEITVALRRSNEDLQRFAYAASHDLQAPLRTISSFLSLLERRLKDRIRPEEREMIAFAQNAAKRMHNLIRDLLAFSRASTERCDAREIDVRELVHQVADDLAENIAEAHATVRGPEQECYVLADETAIRQTLQNLISNAIKYRRADVAPEICVTADDADTHWRICVRDNGQGIAPEYTQQIFEIFQRLHGEEIPGSGIGLAICQRLVHRMGGAIWVDSEPGRGSTFCFTIPKRD